jgi:hypothetical protein
MESEDPVAQAEKIVRVHGTAIRLAAALGTELGDERDLSPDSPLHALRALAERYGRGELSWGEYLMAAREVLPGPTSD